MKNCVFCEIIEKKKAKQNTIFEDDKVLVMLDIDWVVKGHTLVIWKKHFENASELLLENYQYFSNVFHKTEKALLEVLGAERSVTLKSGGLVSHFHFHIYPVKKETSWHEIKNLFDKKVRYEPKPGEQKELILKLKIFFE
jgi:histidine triad (HIT) family protein